MFFFSFVNHTFNFCSSRPSYKTARQSHWHSGRVTCHILLAMPRVEVIKSVASDILCRSNRTPDGWMVITPISLLYSSLSQQSSIHCSSSTQFLYLHLAERRVSEGPTTIGELTCRYEMHWSYASQWICSLSSDSKVLLLRWQHGAERAFDCLLQPTYLLLRDNSMSECVPLFYSCVPFNFLFIAWHPFCCQSIAPIIAHVIKFANYCPSALGLRYGAAV